MGSTSISIGKDYAMTTAAPDSSTGRVGRRQLQELLAADIGASDIEITF
jgi:hypothetical protein